MVTRTQVCPAVEIEPSLICLPVSEMSKTQPLSPEHRAPVTLFLSLGCWDNGWTPTLWASDLEQSRDLKEVGDRNKPLNCDEGPLRSASCWEESRISCISHLVLRWICWGNGCPVFTVFLWGELFCYPKDGVLLHNLGRYLWMNIGICMLWIIQRSTVWESFIELCSGTQLWDKERSKAARGLTFLPTIHWKIALAVYSHLWFIKRWAHPRLYPKVKDFLQFLVISWAVHSEASAYLILVACQSWQFYLLVFPKNLPDIGQPSQLGEKGVSQPKNDNQGCLEVWVVCFRLIL